MKILNKLAFCLLLLCGVAVVASAQTAPGQIKFIRQGVKRLVFDADQAIPLASLRPANIVGLQVMHPFSNSLSAQAKVVVAGDELAIQSGEESEISLWLGGFNPFATYSIHVTSLQGEGAIGFEFADATRQEKVSVLLGYRDSSITSVRLKVMRKDAIVADQSIAIEGVIGSSIGYKIILQMLGSGLMMYTQTTGLPKVIAQADFNKYIDLREKRCINSFQTRLLVAIKSGTVKLKGADMALTPGMGLADIRPITYEDGEPMLDRGRLWYTMSIRGRGLPHPLQGVFSMNPTVFDIKFEGVVMFDREDGLLRNEVASHIFYDRKAQLWRGVTTGFSAYANPDKEKKQLLIIESKQDPRFGFSVMKARAFQMVGDIEDPQMLYDAKAKKWRMIACKNQNGYKAILLESDRWDGGYKQIAGPVAHNSTGTSLQRIGGQLFCFSGSSENKIYTYTYPDLREAGTLQMDLPPWDEKSGSRVWPNVIQLPDGYPFKYVALMMDRLNYPGIQGQNWTYGALYLYHGY